MATVSFSADQDFLVYNLSAAYNGFTNRVESASTFSWYSAGASSEIKFGGSGFTFDGSNVPTAGTVTSFSVDQNHDGGTPELSITGLSFQLTDLASLVNGGLSDDVQESLIWHAVLAGNDTINLGSSATGGNFSIYFAGDGRNAEQGQTIAGGNDKITGDVGGGNIYGDVFDVQVGAAAYGGNDKISATGNGGGYVFGEAAFIHGFLEGGNDTLSEQAAGGIGSFFGDAYQVYLGGSVIGGDDTITMSTATYAYGDLYRDDGALTGGNDKINGSAISNTIYGDTYAVGIGSYLKGGADVVHGGGGADIIYGDWQSVDATAKAIGGNDRLFGDGGKDKLYGNGGNDLLDGGSGGDKMYGGTGNDTYIVDAKGDKVSEAGGGGKDLVKSSQTWTLGSGLDNLTLTGASKINGTGNSGDNVITGNSAHNLLTGGGGKDIFVFNTVLKSANSDAVADFSHASDTFDIDHAVFKGMHTGTLSQSDFTTISSATSTVGVDASDRILYDKQHGDLYFDQDGSGTQYDRVMFAHITANTSIDNTDFHVI